MSKLNGAGVILRKKIGKENYFLLLFSRWGKKWSIPKGHIDRNETPMQTMVRELYEETHIPFAAISLDEGFQLDLSYKLQKPTRKCPDGNKRVRLFAALLTSDIDIRLSKEHTKYIWCTYKEACSILPSEMTRALNTYIQFKTSNQ